MKTAAFHELLKSIRDAGAYLKGNRMAVARTNCIPPQRRVSSLTFPRKSDFK